MRGHPSWESIVRSAEARLQGRAIDGEELRAVESHARRCKRCASLLEDAERLLTSFASVAELPSPPEALVRSTTDRLLAGVRPGKMSVRERLEVAAGVAREVLASLVADSLSPSPVLRGAATAEAPRTLLFEAPGFSIAVSVFPSGPGRVNVLGQISPLRAGVVPLEGQEVVLEAAGRTWTTRLSAYGEFAFRHLPRGTMEVSFLLAGSRLRARIEAPKG